MTNQISFWLDRTWNEHKRRCDQALADLAYGKAQEPCRQAQLLHLSLLLLALPVRGRPNVVQLVFGKLLHLLDAAGSQHLRTPERKLQLGQCKVLEAITKGYGWSRKLQPLL
jgi:hypothetical protein